VTITRPSLALVNPMLRLSLPAVHDTVITMASPATEPAEKASATVHEAALKAYGGNEARVWQPRSQVPQPRRPE